MALTPVLLGSGVASGSFSPTYDATGYDTLFALTSPSQVLGTDFTIEGMKPDGHFSNTYFFGSFYPLLANQLASQVRLEWHSATGYNYWLYGAPMGIVGAPSPTLLNQFTISDNSGAHTQSRVSSGPIDATGMDNINVMVNSKVQVNWRPGLSNTYVPGFPGDYWLFAQTYTGAGFYASPSPGTWTLVDFLEWTSGGIVQGIALWRTVFSGISILPLALSGNSGTFYRIVGSGPGANFDYVFSGPFTETAVTHYGNTHSIPLGGVVPFHLVNVTGLTPAATIISNQITVDGSLVSGGVTSTQSFWKGQNLGLDISTTATWASLYVVCNPDAAHTYSGSGPVGVRLLTIGPDGVSSALPLSGAVTGYGGYQLMGGAQRAGLVLGSISVDWLTGAANQTADVYVYGDAYGRADR